MYIRIWPGGKYGRDECLYKNNRIYKAALPIVLDYRTIKYLRPLMSINAWNVYTVLCWYEHIKFERSIPTLEEIQEDWFKELLSLEEFMAAIEELKELYIKDPELGTIQPILKFVREA